MLFWSYFHLSLVWFSRWQVKFITNDVQITAFEPLTVWQKTAFVAFHLQKL